MMRMMVTSEVLSDMAEVLGPVSPLHQEAVEAIEEIYGCNRMMLATLPRELLSKVCSGWNCDMYEVNQGNVAVGKWMVDSWSGPRRVVCQVSGAWLRANPGKVPGTPILRSAPVNK